MPQSRTAALIPIVTAVAAPVHREGLRLLLQTEPGFKVVGAAGSGGEAVRLARQLKPALLLMEKNLPRMSGLEALRELGGKHPVRVMLLADALSASEILEVLELGARGVFISDLDVKLLFKAVHAVLKGEYWVGREEVGNLLGALGIARGIAAGRGGGGLSPRELAIGEAVGRGMSNKAIARRFALSENTVKHHLTRVFRKLGVASRLELALRARERHWFKVT